MVTNTWTCVHTCAWWTLYIISIPLWSCLLEAFTTSSREPVRIHSLLLYSTALQHFVLRPLCPSLEPTIIESPLRLLIQGTAVELSSCRRTMRINLQHLTFSRGQEWWPAAFYKKKLMPGRRAGVTLPSGIGEHATLMNILLSGSSLLRNSKDTCMQKFDLKSLGW